MRESLGIVFTLIILVFSTGAVVHASLLGKNLQLRTDPVLELDQTMLGLKQMVEKEHVEYTEADGNSEAWIFAYDTTMEFNNCSTRIVSMSRVNNGVIRTENLNSFNLRDIAFVELIQIVGQGTSSIFVRMKTDKTSTIKYNNKMKFDSDSSWKESEGLVSASSIRVGTLSAGERIVRAFKHAVRLCGGAVMEESPETLLNRRAADDL